MANNLVVQLLLKTGAFSNDLKTAKGQIQSFQSGCKTAGNSLNAFGKSFGINLTSITKFGSAVGVATAAGKGLKDIMESNQITGDFFANNIAAARTSVENFAGAIGTLDFTSFYNGLDSVWRKAKDLADTLDQLGDTTMSYGILSGELELDIKRQQLIINDPNSTPEQIQAAKDTLDEISKKIAGYATVAAEDAMKAVRETIIQKSLLDETDLAQNFIADIFHIDLVEARDEIKKSVEKAYDEYKKQARAIRGKYSDYERKHPETDMGARYRNEMSALTQQYSKEIATYTVQVKMSDKQREKLASLIAQKQAFEGKSLDEQLKALEAMNKAEKELAGSAKTTTAGLKTKAKEERTAQENSEKYWEDMIARYKDEAKYVDQTTGKYRELTVIIKNLEEEYQKLKDLNAPLERIDASKFPQMQNYGLGPISESGLKIDVTGADKALETLEEMKIKADNLHNALGSISSMFGSLSGFASSFGTETGDAFATVLDSLGSVAQGIQQFVQIQQAAAMASGTASASGLPFPYNLAAIATVVSTIASVFTKIKSAGKFANGGIVGGNSYTGDRLSASVNSGEMILNRTQQANLFRQINNGGGAGQVEFHISGTELYGVLNNYNRKSRLTR